MGDVVRSLASMSSSSAAFRIEDVLLHPVRAHYYRRKKRRTERDGLAFWVCGKDEESHDGSEAADEDSGDCDEREVLCGMDTVWDGNGASHVALHLFLGEGEDEGAAAGGSWEPSLSCVYSPTYLYTLIYPHIVSSLERSLEALGSEDDYDDDGNDEEEEKGEDDGRYERRAGSR